MLIRYTDEEIMQFQAIIDKYHEKERNIKDLTPEKKRRIYAEFYDEQQALTDSIQKKRFDELKGDPQAVLEHALRQLPQIIEVDYVEILNHINEPDMETFEKMGIAKADGNNIFLYADYISLRIKDELTLHIDFLKEHDQKLLQMLYDSIYDAIAKSDHVTESINNNPFADPAATPEDIPGQLSIFDLPGVKKKDHKESALKRAQKLGAITTIGGHITSISNKHYQFAFSSKINKYAYMVNGGEELLQDIINDTEENDAGLLAVTEDNKKKLIKAAKENPIDSFLVRAFYSAALASEEKKERGTDPRDPDNRYMRVYLPKFCRELNIRFDKLDENTAQGLKVKIFSADNETGSAEEQSADVTDKKNKNFWGRYKELQGYIGVLQERGYYAFVSIALYDAATQMIYLDFPYFYGLTAALREDKGRIVTSKRDKTKILYEKHDYNKLFHSSVVGSRNKAAAEIANLLINGVLQRGGDPDKKLPQNRKKNYLKAEQETVTYKISCKTIVNSIPAFKYRLENMKATDKGRDGEERKKTRSEIEKSILDQQNNALKSAFSGAYKIIRTQSDFYKAFKEAKITEVTPTMRQLEKTEIVITHKGRNPKYKK